MIQSEHNTEQFATPNTDLPSASPYPHLALQKVCREGLCYSASPRAIRVHCRAALQSPSELEGKIQGGALECVLHVATSRAEVSRLLVLTTEMSVPPAPGHPTMQVLPHLGLWDSTTTALLPPLRSANGRRLSLGLEHCIGNYLACEPK